MISRLNQRIEVVCLLGKMEFRYNQESYIVQIGYYFPIEYPSTQPRAVIIPEDNQEVNVVSIYNEQGVIKDMSQWNRNCTISTKFENVQHNINLVPPVRAKIGQAVPTNSFKSIMRNVGQTIEQSISTAMSEVEQNVLNPMFGPSATYIPSTTEQTPPVHATSEPNLLPETNFPQEQIYTPPGNKPPQPGYTAYEPPTNFQSTYLPNNTLNQFQAKITQLVSTNNDQQEKIMQNNKDMVAFCKRNIDQLAADLKQLVAEPVSENNMKIPNGSTCKEILLEFEETDEPLYKQAELQAATQASDRFLENLVNAKISLESMVTLLKIDDLKIRIDAL